MKLQLLTTEIIFAVTGSQKFNADPYFFAHIQWISNLRRVIMEKLREKDDSIEYGNIDGRKR